MQGSSVDRWQFARVLFQQHFQPLRAAGFELERLDDAAPYWQLHEAELRSHFPPEVFFDLASLRTEAQKSGQSRLAELRGGEPLRDFTVIRRGGALVGMFSGEQKADGMYRMWHTNIHRDYRRQGIYRLILESTISYTGALGFDTITSEHAPSNNAVIIAKLRAGFHIYALEIDPGPGLSIVLRYFHNPEALAAYELRCGLATLTPGLASHATGAWPRFRAQVRGALRDVDDGA
jgi:GNAT superfamily N-acetyltransferase